MTNVGILMYTAASSTRWI